MATKKPNPLQLSHPALTPMPGALLPRADSTHRDEKSARADAAPVASGRRSVKREQSPYVAAPKFVRLEGQARKEAALPTLQRALELLQARGWCQGALEDATGRLSLYGAVAEAGAGGIGAEYAREVLRDVLWVVDLVAWNNYPARRRADAVRALRRAIGVAGGHVARGGWRISSGAAQ